MGARTVTAMQEEGRKHVKTAMEACEMQHWARPMRYFAFEHPGSATSWSMPEIIKVSKLERVQIASFDMCQYWMGMVDPDDSKRKPVKMRTNIMTNSPEIANRMSRKGTGDHERIQLEGGTGCKKAQGYPKQLCKTICEGISAQRRHDAMNLVALDVVTLEELAVIDDDIHEYPTVGNGYIAVGDVSGDKLELDLLSKLARRS